MTPEEYGDGQNWGEEEWEEGAASAAQADEPLPGRPVRDRPERSTDNTVRDNHGRLVQAETVNGGIHHHEYREFLGDAATRRLRHAAALGPDRIRDVLATFCPSDAHRYTLFTKELEQHRLGLIVGEPGRGRTSTAIHALATLRPDEPMDEVIVDLDVADAGLAGITLTSDHPRYLDLSDLRDPTAGQRAAVRTLAEKARVSATLLVVICRPGPWEQELVSCRARLRVDAPARAEDVFRHAMARLHGPDLARRWAVDPRVSAVLSTAGPARAVQLVREAERARPPHEPLAGEDHAAWIERALKELTDAADVLPGWSADDPDRRDHEFLRVLIQAVALLEGAPSDTVVHQAQALAERWGVAPMRPTPISGNGITEDLRGIGAHVQADRIRFQRAGHGDDALDHLWREHPGARDSLQAWACEAVPALPKGRRVEVARRWLELARRRRDPAPVQTLLYRWSVSRALRWAAVPALAEAAVTTEVGAAVRSQLYRVATSPKATVRDQVVLEVCRLYGRVQPETALTRLRHIAGKSPGEWTEDLVQALEDIAAEPGNLVLVLEAVSVWVDGEARLSAVAAEALLRLLHGVGEDAPDVRAELERGVLGAAPVSAAWRAAFRSGHGPERVLWSWLDTLAEQHRANGPVAASLLGAAAKDPGFAAALGRCARRWSYAHTRTSPAVEELRRALDET